MTLRSFGSRGALRAVRFAPCVAAAFALACSAASPTPAGKASDASQNNTPAAGDTPAGQTPEPAATALPPGVTATTNDTGETVYMDDMGNVLPTTTADDGTMTLVDPGTGAPVTVGAPTVSSTPSATPAGTDSVILAPEDPVDVLVDPESPPPMDGTLVEGMVCNSSEVMYQPVIPTVMLLIDRSTSMFAPNLPNGSSPTVGTYPDRWEAMRAAVSELEQFSSEVQFGVMTYTGFNQGNGDESCPTLQGEDFPVAVDNFAALKAMLPDSATAIPSAKSETPTGEAISAAAAVLATVPSDGPKYIVLITDGLPEMCGYFDHGVFCGADPTIAATQAAFAQGIQTYVIGIGFDLGNDSQEATAGEYLLNGVAYAGQGLAVPPSSNLDQFRPCLSGEAQVRGETEPPEFYTGENWRLLAQATYGDTGTTFTDQLYFLPGDTQLGEQLSQVVQGVRSCSFEMDDNVIRDQADKGAVQLTMVDGTTQTLTFGDANGWILDPDRDDLVVVQGTACTQVQDQDAVEGVKIEFPCEVRIPKAR
jgi:hypothetical protein